jgi:hypothetical protein
MTGETAQTVHGTGTIAWLWLKSDGYYLAYPATARAISTTTKPPDLAIPIELKGKVAVLLNTK